MLLMLLVFLFIARECITVISVSTDIVMINRTEVEHWARYKQWEKPICLLFPKKESVSTPNSSSIETSLRKAKLKEPWSSWVFAKLFVQKNYVASDLLQSAPEGMLRCFLGTASYFDYNSTTTVRKWLRKMAANHKDRLKALANQDIDSLFRENLSIEIFIVVFPGNVFFEVIEKALTQVRGSCSEFCRIVVVPPDTDQEGVLADKYDVRIYPNLLIFQRRKRGAVPVLKKQLQGIHQVNSKENILQAMHIIQLGDKVLTFDSFASSALVTRQKMPPLVVCFYSPLNPASFSHLNAFHRAVKKQLKVNLRFAIVDISNSENANIISRYLDASEVKKIPFLAVFWQSLSNHDGFSSGNEVRNKVLPDLIPTPWNLEVMLRDLGVQNQQHVDVIQRPKHMFCSVNSTDICTLGDVPPVIYGPVWGPTYTPKVVSQKPPLFKKLHGIPLLTDSLWHRIIEQTSPIRSTSQRLFQGGGTENQAVKLVIFIIADCGYCEIMMPTFEKLTKSAMTIHGVSVYLMSCTANPIQCKANQVTGYPTLALFRSLSEEESRSCALQNSTSSSVRLDYHELLQVDDILKWLSKASMSAVRMDLNTDRIMDMKMDARLTARLYTRKQARMYLPRSLQGVLVPFQCFKLACERLFATVECVARRSTDVEADDEWRRKIHERDLFIEMVVFERVDGIKVTVFKLTYPMEMTMSNEQSSALHAFHSKHRYSIPSGFKCESDHPLCTYILVRFVEDHLRLPITHITKDGFHAHSTTSSIFSKEFPVLIALVHKENITSNSTFLKELHKAAKNLYTKLIFATLNVDEFPSWASQFVPRNYHSDSHGIIDKVPALYHYPRLCIIDWHDHQHAAFYPPIKDLEQSKDINQRLSKISANDIIKFSREYFLDKDSLSVETEMF
eukprot:gene8174-9050_t